MIIRREALKAALHCLDPDVAEQAMGNLHIRPDGVVEATDGVILVRVSDKSLQAPEDFPQVPGITTPFTPSTTGILLPPAMARKLIAAMPKKAKAIPILGGMNIGMVDDHCYAVATDLETPLIVCLDRAQDAGTYPATDRVVVKPEDRQVVKLTLAAERLEQLAKLAREIGRRASLNAITLEIPIDPKDQGSSPQLAAGPTGDIRVPVRFTAEGDDLRVEGMVMPCRV